MIKRKMYTQKDEKKITYHDIVVLCCLVRAGQFREVRGQYFIILAVPGSAQYRTVIVTLPSTGKYYNVCMLRTRLVSPNLIYVEMMFGSLVDLQQILSLLCTHL